MSQEQDTIMKSQANQTTIDFMHEAYKEAKKALKKNEVPVGAVVVYKNKIIAKGHNTREKTQSFHAHAEFIAMMKAARFLGTWRLDECEVYVTMEPCPMCAGAMIQSRIKKVHYATKDLKSGVVDSIINMFDLPFNHHVQVERGLMEKESETLLKDFFKTLRNK
jgi:tRNA(adenine34) deaminase